MGFGIPSFSDIRNAVTSTVSTAASRAASGVSGAASSVRDFGAAAVERTQQLARDGVDLGRRAVNAVRSVDVREAASVVQQKIGEGTEAAREGIRHGVDYAAQRTGDAADFARAHVPGGDNVVSNGIRGAITTAENSTRFQLGVVGGVTREVVGLAGTVGQLGTTAVEMRLSPAASAEYGQRIVDGVSGAVEATGNYIESAASDPSRIGRDLSSAADAGGQWVDGQVNRYQQAFRDGKGFETVGMDVGTVATYVVPVGGGPARGALTAAARGGTEAVAREGAEAVAREGAEAIARGGDEIASKTVSAVEAAATQRLQSLGKVTGTHSAIEPGPLSDNLAATFSGGRYSVVQLAEDTVLHRAGTADQPLGQFFTREPPTSVIKTRIDSAVLPEWPGGAKSPLDSAFAVTIPKGTPVYVGEVGSQGGFYVGGTEQIVVAKPWTIPGVTVNSATALK